MAELTVSLLASWLTVQKLTVCLCVCVLTSVVQITTATRGDPDTHPGHFPWAFLPSREKKISQKINNTS